MMSQAVLALRITASFLLMTLGSLVMLAAALATGFQAPRLYREGLAARFGRGVLRIWGIHYTVHREAPFPHGQAIYISNHTSSLDLFVLIALRFPNARFFLSGWLRKLPPLALVGYLIGIFWTVPQHLPERRARIFQRAERVLRKSGESVYLSPEGTRITHGGIGPFNRGAFHLATALHAPIVPVFIRIPKSVHPGTGLRARPGKIDVFIKPAIDTSTWRLESLPEHKETVRNLYVDWNRALQAV